MSRLVVAMLPALTAGLAGMAWPQTPEPDSQTHERPTLAVVDFRVIGEGLPAEAGVALAENLLGEFGSDRHSLIERGMLERLLAEQRLQASDLADDQQRLAEFGRMQGVRYIVTGSINRFGSLNVTARLIDTETAQIQKVARITGRDLLHIEEQLAGLARRLHSPTEHGCPGLGAPDAALEPRVLLVAADGSGQHRTIGAALLSARMGDVVRVLPGVYREQLTLTSGVTLVGTNREVCVVEWTGEGAAITLPPGATAVVESLTVDGRGQASGHGIAADRARGAIRNCVVQGFGGTGIRVVGAGAEVDIVGCISRSNRLMGIGYVDGARGTARENLSESNGQSHGGFGAGG